MKTLKHLEKKRYVWFLIGLCSIFFLLRLPSLVEPNWYGDEGIYQVISLALHNGKHLYSDIWDNKPPLLYVVYALFSGDQFLLRFLSLILGIYTTIVFFFLSRKLFDSRRASSTATVIFTLLFATPFLEGNIANAENFMLPFSLTAGLIVYTLTNKNVNSRQSNQRVLLLAGFLMGIAFLFKIVAIFDFAAFSLFLIFLAVQKESVKRNQTVIGHVKKIFSHARLFMRPLLSGFLPLIVITFAYFAVQGTLTAFIQAAFFGNIEYVNYGNSFIIPQGLLLLKITVFIAALIILYRNLRAISKPVLFITVWFIFALFSAFFSQRPYTHYLLVLLPSFSLMVGLVFATVSLQTKARVGTIIALVSIIAMNYFPVFGVAKTFEYYQNVISFLSGHKSVKEYQSFFDPETPRDYEVVAYIKNHTTQADKVFLWGDSPQIYFLANKLPPGRYSVSYHVIQDPNGVRETQAVIDKTQPKFIITLSEAPPIPLQLPGYVGKYGLKGATIYERAY